MDWRSLWRSDPLPWLLETQDPGVRYLALRDLADCSAGDPSLGEAQKLAYSQGPIGSVLAEMHPEGYWVEPGPGYNPKYRSTVWAIILLAQLGASAALDERIERACAYVVDHALVPSGQFTTTGSPSGTADCLQGNLCWALLELGYADPRLEAAYDWMARTVTGEGIAPVSEKHAQVRYYAGKCGPVFACGANNRLSCAWGGVKVMLALGKLPRDKRTPQVDRAVEQGVDFLFSVDPATAAYPCGWAEKPSGNWWKFGFPVFYITDLLQLVEVLVKLGYGGDGRLANAVSLILSKGDESGRWASEFDYSGKTWVDFGVKKQPNKWVTVRALRVLKQIGCLPG